MGYVNIFDTGPAKVTENVTDVDKFSLKLGPAEIEHLPLVSGFIYENRTEADWVVADGKVVCTTNKGHVPGQTEIRKLAAETANENAVSSTWAEFGVELGRSAFFLSHYLPKDGKFFLFDSFEGLPEDWALSYKNVRPGELWACEPPTFEDPRMVVVEGWFDDTLPHAAMTGPLGLVHIDSDLYSSAKTVLERIDSQIVPGTIILFDELWGYPNWAEGEYKALMEWGREFTYLARDTRFRVLIEIK